MTLPSPPANDPEEAESHARSVSRWPYSPFHVPLLCLFIVPFLTLGNAAVRSPATPGPSPGTSVGDPDRIRYVPTDSSRFLIEGRTNVHGFTCEARSVDGFGHLPATQSRSANQYPVIPEVEVRLQVPVRSLECGNSRMNRDLYETLKADRHPYIRFDLTAVTVRDTPSPSEDRGIYRLEVGGTLTIADSTRKVRFDMRGRRVRPGMVRGEGSTRLEMSSFGIEPPSAVMGLIQVRDEITVRFDLTARAASPAGDRLGHAGGP